MKVQKKISVGGQFAKVKEDINDGDVITIVNEGQVITGDYGDRNVFKISTPNGERVLSFNQTSQNNLIDAFGDDTINWVNKKIKVWVVKQMIDKKLRNVVYLTATDWIMTDDGQFAAQIGQDTGTSSGINPDDIPF